MKLTRNDVLTVCVVVALWGQQVVVASAAPTEQWIERPTHVFVNGVDVSNPDHFVTVDSWSGVKTSWVPLAAMQQALRAANLHTTWNGATLNFIPPFWPGWKRNPNITFGTEPTTGKRMSFAIQGVQLEYAPLKDAKSPVNGQMTAYIPIYYANEFIQKIFLIQTQWNGIDWHMNPPAMANVSVKP